MDKFYNMLGLAKKAGFTAEGEKRALESIKREDAVLCILAKDASQNTRKRIHDKCKNKSIEVIEYGNMEDIGKYTARDIISVVCIKNEGFAVQLKKLAQQT